MPQFGKQTVGASTLSAQHTIVGLRAVSGGPGDLQSITAYLAESTTNNGRNVKCALYDDAGNFIAETEVLNSVTTAPAWHTFNFSTPLAITNTTYVIVVWADGGAGNLNVYYDSDVGDGVEYTAIYGAFPDPVVWTTNLRDHSIYATYTTGISLGGSLQAQDAVVSGATSNDPVSDIITTTITTAAGISGSIQAQDAAINSSLAIMAPAADVTVSGSVQSQDANVGGSIMVVSPLTAVLIGGVQAQDVTISGSLLAFISYQFKYTTAAKLFSAFGKTEMALIASPEQSTVSGDLFYAVMMNKNLSTWSLQQIADANDAASRLADTIQSAEHLIDSYISPRYPLPLSQDLIDTSPLPTYCNAVVRFMLMDDRTTEEVDKRYDQAMKWLRDVSMNKASLGVDDTAVASSAGRMVSRRGRSKLNWDGF